MYWLHILSVFCIAAAISADPWLLETDSLPTEEKLLPAIGNGHLATNAKSSVLYLNAVFNGNGSDSHRAMIPSTAKLRVNLPGGKETATYALNMKKGVFIETIENDECVVQLTYFAHRIFTRLLIVDLLASRKKEGTYINIDVELDRDSLEENPDFSFTEYAYDSNTWLTIGETLEAEADFSSTTKVFIYWTAVNTTIELPDYSSSATWQFITAASIDQQDARNAYDAARFNPTLLSSHTAAWEDIWNRGSIQVEGNDDVASTICAAQYYIMCSTPLVSDPINPFIGLSPGGLSRGGKINTTYFGGAYNDYAGHVFWDMDTWIMPPIMMLHPEAAEIMIESRARVRNVVLQHAINTGYTGVRYPWEQAVTGIETCPWDLASEYQVHVTADVSYSIRQYLYATGDENILWGQVGNLVTDIARFWQSRSVQTNRGYEIIGVMGPDEYHYNVNNSVFTNYNARLSLKLPKDVSDLASISRSEIEDFEEIADNMFMPFDEERQYHPQFEGFDPDDAEIKQSDAVLLGYPLMKPMTPQVRQNDLEIYEEVTDSFGPDTGTWSMHTVGWLELGNEDRANATFKTMFRNINGPFKVFSEKPDENEQGMRCTNFITGAGGLLQAVVFGYAGMRVRMHQMDIDPYIPKDAERWSIIGLNYLGHQMDMDITDEYVIITLTQHTMSANDRFFLQVWTNPECYDSEKDPNYELQLYVPLVIPRGKATIYAHKNQDRVDYLPPCQKGTGGHFFLSLGLLAICTALTKLFV